MNLAALFQNTFNTEMSAKKASTQPRPWVKSAFSQYDTPATPQSDDTPSKKRRITRSASCIEIKPTTNKPAAPKSDLLSDNSNWIDRFAPTSADDLALHAKKITELQSWFQHCNAVFRKHPAQLCLLTGPAGSSKTAAIRVLAKDAGYKLLEWINPADADEVTRLGDQDADYHNYGRSQLDAFKQFLFGGSRYKSVFAHLEKRMLLVEDFPNALISNTSLFEELLTKYINCGKSPLVFIATDSKSRRLNISYNLFPDELKDKFSIVQISFNAIADTIMHKAIKRLCILMHDNFAETYKAPTQTLLDSIVLSANGDVRNALINLHFSSLKGMPCMPMEQVAQSELSHSTSGKRKTKNQYKLTTMGVNRSVTMFHALGRVFNPKYTDDRKLVYQPEEISADFSTEPKKFTEFIHANYLPHFGEIDDVVNASNGLCVADLMLTEYREDALSLLGLTIAVRSIMATNTTPQKGWRPVHGAKRITINIFDELSSKEKKLVDVTQGISTHVYASDYATFVKLIAGG